MKSTSSKNGDPDSVDGRKAPFEVIENIWHRARINAFAHKLAAERFARRASRAFLCGLVSAVLSILFVILVYAVNSADGETVKVITSMLRVHSDLLGLVFALSSVVFSLASMVSTVIGNVERFDIRAAEHRFFCNSYQYIAQRAREVNWPDKPASDVVALLEDLERDFQLLKARGWEPEDCFFDEANQLFEKVHENEETRRAQSFDLSGH